MKLTVGRYAPSPTGRLHLGNLRTALLSWLQVKLQGGRFLVRIEDLDQPRVVRGSESQMMRDLEWLGLSWDESVVRQSERIDLYHSELSKLQEMNLIYPCFCSRKELRDAVSAPHGTTPVYPGTCAALSATERAIKQKEKSPAIRLRVPDQRLEFEDVVSGKQGQHLRRDVGDFVIRRADGLFAYQFAVVVDDIQQGVTDVVRGADLLDSTARQLYLASLINADNAIRYWHVPLVMDASGQRMAKRDGSNSLAEWQAEGKRSDQLIGEFAYQLSLVDRNEALSAEELAMELTESAFITALKTHA